MSDESQKATETDVPPWAAGTAQRHHELNPELSEADIEIVRQYGEERDVADGTMLWDIGDRNTGFFLVLEGEVEIVRRGVDGEHVIITHGRGHYGGETVTMIGGGALVAGRAKGPTRVIAVEPNRLRELLATEAQLGETILLSFILRRMRMIAEQQGDVTLMGPGMGGDTGKLRTFLSRNGVPHRLVDTDTADDVDAWLGRADATGDDLPAVLCGDTTLRRPSIRELAECLGIAAEVRSGLDYDLAVIGAGPAGLAAAVYGASEGLRVAVIESCAPGGQAGTSSRIENYLGFPTGISGQALAGRAYLQANKFGAEVAIARSVEHLHCGEASHVLELDGGDTLNARAVVLASGAVYRQPDIENLEALEGSGVHYGASHVEGQLCRGRDVLIVGGGNSAGQAAVFLSRHARTVRILVRGEGLAGSMSEYLVRRIERTSNIELVPHTEIVRVEGERRLERAVLRDRRDGTERTVEAMHLFIFIGAVPATEFARSCLRLDGNGFVKTGEALSDGDLTEAGWPLERRPHLLETSTPRVFAAGDVRSGSVKRVASAVGEGSICIQFVHQAVGEAGAQGEARSAT